MNAVKSFIENVFSDSKPVGLMSFKGEKIKRVIVKKNNSKKDVKLSDLMRRPH